MKPNFSSPVLFSLAIAAAFAACPASAAIVSIPVINGDFETGTAGSSVIAGWTLTSSGGDGFWLTDTGKSTATDPPLPYSGNLFLSANRLAGVPTVGAQPAASTLSQTVALAPAVLEIATGTATFDLSFAYNDADRLDGGQVDVTFFDAALAQLGPTVSLGDRSSNTSAIVGTPANLWELRSLTGAVPAGATTARIDLHTQRYSASATNVAFDAITFTVIPEPSSALLGAAAGLLLLGRRHRK